MAALTNIEWADSTANYWEGCTEVSKAESGGGGCDNCYAAARNRRFHAGENWGPGAPRRKIATTSKVVRSWQRGAAKFHAKHGRNRRVFVNSLSDWLDNEVPIPWLLELLEDVRICTDLTFQLLTKRIGNWVYRLTDVSLYIAELQRIQHREASTYGPLKKWLNDWLDGVAVPAHVRIGITVVNQREADRDIGKLCAVPARIRFLSLEPLLEHIDLSSEFIPIETGRAGEWRACSKWGETTQVHWLIIGGESGHGARWCSVEWIRSLVAQGRAAGAAVLVKQLGRRPTYNGMTEPGTHWPAGVTFWSSDIVHGRIEFQVNLKHKKGSDVQEWPEDLRVREFPDVYTEAELAAAGDRAREFARTIKVE